MKFCPNCGTQQEEGALSCPNCGTVFSAAPVVTADPADHTAEFEPADISQNKVFALLPYLMGLAGLIVALLARLDSPYTTFHVRQYLKICICEAIVGILAAVLCWTLIVPLAAGICVIILLVLRIIGFIQVCKGQATEPAIIGKFGFLR